ncbi:MAG: putative outer membrane efflux protein MdtP [Syntrophorhabdus sp. PtaU1.Bin002]|nr:MAG: putative outer membrane efflux protein MdtP [Syntrophorhabdus sp. PtaU1.Bin002]
MRSNNGPGSGHRAQTCRCIIEGWEFAAGKKVLVAKPIIIFILVFLFAPFATRYALCASADEPLELDQLIEEALKNSPELLVAESKTAASVHRIPQAKSLPDPMFMFGYQNEGTKKLTLGEEADSMGMFSLSQMFLFPGKRALKGDMATQDMESLKAMHKATQLKTIATVKQLYYDLFLAHKTVDILKRLTEFFSRIEDAANARYSSGMGSQQEVIMAQTEKYMLLEKEEMQKQKIQAVQGMLNTAVGRPVDTPMGRPVNLSYTSYKVSMKDLLRTTKDNSPELRSREKMIEGAKAKLEMARKEYYPDFTIAANYYPKTNGFMDMWSMTATINIPIFYKTKQDQAVLEAQANLLGAEREAKTVEYMLSSSIRDNYSMARTAENLMKLYKEGVIPKTYQDFQLALSGYAAGKTEAITAISRLKALLDTELLYWIQYVEREKAIARLDALTGETGSEFKVQDPEKNNTMQGQDSADRGSGGRN